MTSYPGPVFSYGLCVCFPGTGLEIFHCEQQMHLWEESKLHILLRTEWKGHKFKGPFPGPVSQTWLAKEYLQTVWLALVSRTDRRDGSSLLPSFLPMFGTHLYLFPWADCVHLLRLPFTNGPVIPDLPERLIPKYYREKSNSFWIIPVIDLMLVSS